MHGNYGKINCSENGQVINLNRLLEFMKNALLDILSAIKGYVYGFFLVATVILLGTGVYYLFLYVKNVLI